MFLTTSLSQASGSYLLRDSWVPLKLPLNCIFCCCHFKKIILALQCWRGLENAN